MKLITSVGTGKYNEVSYIWNGKEHKTDIFPDALVEWLQPQKTVVLLTQESAERYWETLRSLLGTRTSLHRVDIPDGHSEAEIWEIFDKIVQSVEQGEEVAIDITHAFRSLPLIFFVVTAYLRVVKKVKVSHVLYGCYISDDQPAPVIDLRLMLDLLDWMEGVRRFRELGDARFMGKTLKNTQNTLYRERSGGAKPTKLKGIGKLLLDLSDNLHALRVRDVMKTSTKLKDEVQKAATEVQQWAKPFGLMMEEVQQLAGELAYDNPNVLNADTLQKQHSIIRKLIEHRQLVQAVLLQREWLVNYVLWRTEKGNDWLRQDSREEAECSLNELIELVQNPQNIDASRLGKYMEQGEIERVARLWSSLREPRNDLAHCGMRQNIQPASSLLQKVCEFERQLGELLEGAQMQP
ncbi:MAG: TIGR02221 family CRISPR-associated protein [Armatimonadota bacterium]